MTSTSAESVTPDSARADTSTKPCITSSWRAETRSTSCGVKQRLLGWPHALGAEMDSTTLQLQAESEGTVHMADSLPRAFFSYSRHDSEFVLKLAKDLREGGAQVWLDQLDIDPGQRWDSAVEQALSNCRTMLLVLSPSSVASTNVMDEVSYALEERKLIIPILHQDCKIPFRLRRVQYVDVRTDYQDGVHELLRMLDARQAQAAALNDPAAPALAGESQEIARVAREREESAANKAPEQAERERTKREAAARIPRERANTAAKAVEPQTAQRHAMTATGVIESPSSWSSRKFMMIGAGAVLVIGGLSFAMTSKRGEEALGRPATVTATAKETQLPAVV